MKVLIVYASKYGTVKAAVESLQEEIKAEVHALPVKEASHLSIKAYNLVLIAGSVHAGMVQSGIKRFCDAHLPELKQVPVAIMLSCATAGEKAMEYIHSNFPASLVAHAFLKETVGGRIHLNEVSWLDKFLLKRVAKVTEDVDTYKPEKVAKIAEAVNREL